MKKRILAALVASVVGSLTLGLAPLAAQDQGSLALALELRRLDGVKRVLMIGAHPDDEDTSLLAELSRGHGAETAYLSLTRGEGGQNLIGPQLGEGLGIVRTGELLAARRLDGGRQFFTRAFDYGFSKNAAEALALWPEEELLGDVVWTVRNFRPHVIVSVFSGTPADGHGQHQAAGIMANRVFDAAADPLRYPEQLGGGVGPWQTSKLYRNAWRNPTDATTAIQTGTYDPLLGRSNHQVAMESRSQHRSQEMGSAQGLGPRQSGLQLIRVAPTRGSGDEALQALSGAGFFAGVDTAFVSLVPSESAAAASRASLEAYREAIEDATVAFDPFDPTPSFVPLAAAMGSLDLAYGSLPPGSAYDQVRQTIDERRSAVGKAAIAASGIVWDVRASDDLIVPGQVFRIDVEVWNGGTVRHATNKVTVTLPPGAEVTETEPPPLPGRFGFRRGPTAPTGPGPNAAWLRELVVRAPLNPGDFVQRSFFVRTAENTPPTRLYYLAQERDGARYRWPDRPELWGMPRDSDPLRARLEVWSDDRIMATERTVRFRGVDPAKGEFSQPVQMVPALSVSMDPGVLVWPEGSAEPRAVRVTVRSSAEAAQSGSVRLELPAGFRSEPELRAFELGGAGAEATLSFELLSSGLPAAGTHPVRAVAQVGERFYSEKVEIIDYEHIPRTPLYHAAETQLSVFPVRVAEGLELGYVMGSGDAGPDAVRQLGVEPTMLNESDLASGDLDRFDVIVLGVRAYATRDDLRRYNERVLQFARDGGTLIVQYNQYEFPRGGYAPYPLDISRPHDRVTVEEAPVTILDPNHPLASVPNQIGASDFEGWIQERGLYFLGEWDERYTPLLEMNDPGEDPKRGALVVAPVGRGTYVYTGLSFFRQLPAGVAGAYRLFANLISLKSPGVS